MIIEHRKRSGSMNVRDVLNDLQRIETDLELAKDHLATNHAFTRLIEEELHLDVKSARADAWISIEQAAILAGPEFSDFHDGYDSNRSAFAKKVAALSEAIASARGDFSKIKPELFGEDLSAWDRIEQSEERREGAEWLGHMLDRVAKRLNTDEWREWVERRRPDPDARDKLLEELLPSEKAQALYRRIDAVLEDAANTCQALATKLQGRRPGR